MQNEQAFLQNGGTKRMSVDPLRKDLHQFTVVAMYHLKQ